MSEALQAVLLVSVLFGAVACWRGWLHGGDK